MKKLTFLLAAALFASLAAWGQVRNFTIEGKVTSGGRPVASVPVTDGTSITLTDAAGAYRLESNSSHRYVYYTLPSGYESVVENSLPEFYKAIPEDAGKVVRADFELLPAKGDQIRHAFFVWADPQIAFAKEFDLLAKVRDDVVATIDSYHGKMPFFGISLGDEVFEKPEFYAPYKESIARIGVPFYQVLGNHDMDFDLRSDELSDLRYCQEFGPSHYAFNRGRAHYVVLKDVFYYGYAHKYMGYITEQQLAWLEQDLKTVKPGSLVIVSLHIPTAFGGSETPAPDQTLTGSVMNNKALYKILAPYNAHILAGHSHNQWNTVISDSLFEHVHAAASGAWWQGPLCTDGVPLGYTVYEVDGDKLTWYFKASGHPRTKQMRLYYAVQDNENPGKIVANVYNYDPQWKVSWYENGVRMGSMEQFWGTDPQARRLYPPGATIYKWLKINRTQHLFRATPHDPSAKIEVEAIDRFGNVYRSSRPPIE